jgi:hypothetical protein
VVSEAALPDREVGCEARGEDAFDSLEGGGEVASGEEQVDVVGHDDEGVEFVEACGAVVLQRVGEEGGVGVDLEEAAAVVGDRGEEARFRRWRFSVDAS